MLGEVQKGMKMWLFVAENLSLGLKIAGNMENGKVEKTGQGQET